MEEHGSLCILIEIFKLQDDEQIERDTTGGRGTS